MIMRKWELGFMYSVGKKKKTVNLWNMVKSPLSTQICWEQWKLIRTFKYHCLNEISSILQEKKNLRNVYPCFCAQNMVDFLGLLLSEIECAAQADFWHLKEISWIVYPNRVGWNKPHDVVSLEWPSILMWAEILFEKSSLFLWKVSAGLS